MPLPFVTQFRYPTVPTRQLRNENAGEPGKYELPVANIQKLVAQLPVVLKRYKTNPTEENMLAANLVLKQLDMVGYRIRENEDIVFFAPRNKAQLPISFFWNFNPNTLPFWIASPHEGKDNAGDIAFAEFMLGAEFLLLNAKHPNASKVPSPFQKSRSASDAAHSPLTYFPAFLQSADRVCTDYAAACAHGLAAKGPNGKPKKLRGWIINGRDGNITKNRRDFAALLTVARAQFNFGLGTFAIGGDFSEFFIVNEARKKLRLTPRQKGEVTVFSRIDHPPNTDVVMHIIQGSRSLRSRGADKFRGVHMEHGPVYTSNPALRKQLLNTYEMAIQWFREYDDRVHNLENLPPEIKANMRLYPAYVAQNLAELKRDPNYTQIMSLSDEAEADLTDDEVDPSHLVELDPDEYDSDDMESSSFTEDSRAASPLLLSTLPSSVMAPRQVDGVTVEPRDTKRPRTTLTL